MEPASIIDGIAGIATAGIALSRALFDLAGGFEEAPAAVVEMAQSLSDASIASRELRRVMRRNKRLCRNRLIRAVDSLMGQVENVQDEIFDIVRSSGTRISRVISAFRGPKAMELLEQVKTHKTTLQLMATTILLAEKEKEHGATRSDRFIYAELERERVGLRRDTETLLRQLGQFVQSLSHGQLDRGVSTQTNASESLSVPNLGDRFNRRSRSRSRSVGSRSRSPAYQAQQAAGVGQNGALWLYELVFGSKTGLSLPSAEIPPSSDEILMAVAMAYVGDQALSTGPVSPVVDGLLLRWTMIQPNEIFGPVLVVENRELERWESILRERVHVLKSGADEDNSMPALPAPRDSSVEPPRREPGIPRVQEPIQEPTYENDNADKPRTEAHAKLEEINERFRKLIPPCVKFITGPPADPEKRADEHRRHSELILQHVILKLDNLDVEGNDSIRAMRRNLVKEAQEMLDKLDASVKDAAKSGKGKTRRESAAASGVSPSVSYQDPESAYGSDSDLEEVHPRRYRFAADRGDRSYEEPPSPRYEPGYESRRAHHDVYGTSPREGQGSMPTERRTAYW